MAADDIEYRVMRAEDSDAVYAIYYDHLWNDPTYRCIASPPYDVPREVVCFVKPTVERCLQDGIGMVAVNKSSGEIVGIRVNYIITKERGEAHVDAPRDNPDTTKMYYSGKFFEKLYEGLDVFQRYGVDKYASFRGMGVKQSHRQRGIAGKLIQESLKMFSELGFKLVVGEAASNYVRHAFNRAGFAQINILDFETFEYEGHRPFPTPGVNKSESLHIKKL